MEVTRVGSKLLLTVSEQEAVEIVRRLEHGPKSELCAPLKEALASNASLPRLKDFTRDLEAMLLTEALATDHNLNRAAKTLGFKHHQSLISLLNSRRHQGLRERIGLAPAKTRHRPLRNQKTEERVTPARSQRRGPKMHVATQSEWSAQ